MTTTPPLTTAAPILTASRAPRTTAHGAAHDDARGDVPFRIGTVIVPLIAIVIGVVMVVLDSTVVNVALPKLVTDLHATLPTLRRRRAHAAPAATELEPASATAAEALPRVRMAG